MNVPTIEMDQDEAQEAFEAYREQVKARHSAEDEQIMRGYKALAEGKSLLNLYDVMKSVGVDEKQRPKLAICRSDARWCFYRTVSSVPSFAKDSEDPLWRSRVAKDRLVKLPIGTFPILANAIRALVPTIPPALRPKRNLAGYFTLWEAEWEPVPPVDPMLLKHISGPLYAVLATWDLTPLEQTVLAGRLLETPR